MGDEYLDDGDKVRFLVTITRDDLKALDEARKRSQLSRNRFIVTAIWKQIAALNESGARCPICGKENDHVH